MKVIASIDSQRLLCEISIEELALLNGFRNAWDEGFKRGDYIKVGSECNLAKMAATSNYVRTMNKDTLAGAKAKLEQGIKTIDIAMEEITKLTIFETLKETQ